jgi:arabinogalactan oligomer/maltooligosaccharide transport system substrate-binding protein
MLSFKSFVNHRLSGLLGAGLLLGLGAQPVCAAELVVWHAYRGGEKAAFEKVVGMFNDQAKADGIKVKTLAVPYDAYADKITAAVPRGKGPDIFIFAQDRLGGWIEGGKTIESIDFYLEDETVDALLPGMLDAMTYRDTVYGLPLNYKSIAMIYNKALVAAPPETSAELVSVAKKLTNPGVGKFGLVYAYSDYYYHASLMNAFGGRVFDPGPTPVLDAPENIEAIKLMLKWYKEDGILPADPSTALITALFNEGNAGIVFSGPWFLGEIAEGIDYGIAVLPTLIEADGAPMRPWLTIEGIYISQSSQHKDEAYEFAKYMVSAEVGLVLALEGGQLHTNKAVYENEQVANDPVLSGFRAQYENAIPMPNYAEMTLMWSPVTTAMNKIVKGSATPEAAMAEAQKTIEDGLAALRKGR